MAENWYPVIDKIICSTCGLCVENCPHLVYDKENFPIPNVIKPLACIDGCHGCGNNCPTGAITYFNDNTDWKPPALNQKENLQDSLEESCCKDNCNIKIKI